LSPSKEKEESFAWEKFFILHDARLSTSYIHVITVGNGEILK